MDESSHLATNIIVLFQSYIHQLGYKPMVHFELEGCYRFPDSSQKTRINLDDINKKLSALDIEGAIVHEYWHGQWEYVSKLAGQSPLKEAQNLACAIKILPELFAEQGVCETYIKPVVWSGDTGKLANGSKNIFTNENRDVHIPNAVQINISASNLDGKNLIAESFFGEHLQACFLATSLESCLLYLPESEAFERLLLKSKYGLSDELCSPIDISGGHQGSIALYKEQGKHNQPMGIEPVLYDRHHQVMLSKQNWQKTARIEHRLGASSTRYNPYLNVVFALANLIDALHIYDKTQCKIAPNNTSQTTALPTKLSQDENGFDAVTLFENSVWLVDLISTVQQRVKTNNLPHKHKINETLIKPQHAQSYIDKQLTEEKEFFNSIFDNDVLKDMLQPNIGEQLKQSVLSLYKNNQSLVLPI